MEVSGRKEPKTDGHRTCLLCDPCKGENEYEPAVAYCIICNEYFCFNCRKAHIKTKISKVHEFLDGASMPKQKLASGKVSMCPKHSDKSLEYYCNNENQFSCSVCVIIEHNQCSVQPIDDIATDYHKSNEYVALEKTTADLVRLLQETKVTANRNMNDIANIHANFVSDLQQLRSEINNILDSLDSAAMTKALIARDSDQKKINSIATACDSMLSDIQRKTSELDELNKYKQNRQLVICSKRAMKTVNTYDNRVNKMSSQNRIRDYKFQPSAKIRLIIHSLNNLLGNMKDGKHDKHTRHGTSTNKGDDSATLNSIQSTATHVDNIDVKHSTEAFGSWITGGAIIDETKLALVDYRNYSVKIVNLDRNIITACTKLATRPWDTTCVNPEKIVVCCNEDDKSKLVFLNVGKSLCVGKDLAIKGNCRSIVHANGTFFVSFYGAESSVKEIDLNGNVLKTFKTHKNGGALSSDPGYICLSTNQQTVLVSDLSNDIITSLTLEGTVHHVYKVGNLKSPCGLAVDRNKKVYIAGYLSHNIHLLSPEDNQRKVILDMTRGIVSPCMVTYCKTRHRLYISVEKDGSDEVCVYQLQS